METGRTKFTYTHSLTPIGQGTEKGLESAFIPLAHSDFLSGVSLSSFFAASTFFTSSLAGGFWSAPFATGGDWSPSLGDCSAGSAECVAIKNVPRLAKITKQSGRRLSMVSLSRVRENFAIRKIECQQDRREGSASIRMVYERTRLAGRARKARRIKVRGSKSEVFELRTRNLELRIAPVSRR